MDNERKTRVHNLKMTKQLTTNMKRYNFFTNRVVNDWNDVEQDAIHSSTVNQLNNKIDKIFKY